MALLGLHCFVLLAFQPFLHSFAQKQERACIREHTIKENDSCLSISQANGLSEIDLMHLNPKLNCSSSNIGQAVCTMAARVGPKWNSSESSQLSRQRKVFMEYLGAEGSSVNFNQPPISPDVDFYYILSFAVDADADGKPMNGVFNNVWAEELDPKAVQEIKSKHSNVNVLMSLAGWSVYTRAGKDKVLFWYDPKDSEKWIKNAYMSIRKTVEEFGLDGIDIDYESFRRPNTTFAYCIGELITRLKRNNVVKIVTIAPFENIEAYYVQLYNNYSSLIDYVNYQFYTTHRAPSVDKFVRTYVSKATTFGVNKTMVSMQIRDRGIQGQAFFDGVQQILNVTNGSLPGIMIWSVDSSVRYKTNFWYENQSQAILAAYK